MRVENWPTLLTNYLESCKDVPFKWGEHDCCTFVSDWILLATEVDPMVGIRGTYNSMKTARKVIEETYYIDLADSLFERIDKNLAQRGDIGCIDGTHGLTMGIIRNGIVLAGKEGTVVMPISDCKICWRVE